MLELLVKRKAARNPDMKKWKDIISVQADEVLEVLVTGLTRTSGLIKSGRLLVEQRLLLLTVDIRQSVRYLKVLGEISDHVTAGAAAPSRGDVLASTAKEQARLTLFIARTYFRNLRAFVLC